MKTTICYATWVCDLNNCTSDYSILQLDDTVLLEKISVAIFRPTGVSILLLALGVITISARAQSTPKVEFVIDPNHQYVYLKFDHIGPGIRRDRHESATRVWVSLINNCNVPIVVSENGTPDGSPKDERQIMYRVVPTIMPEPILTFSPNVLDDDRKKMERPKSANGSSEKIPRGYMEEVGSTEIVAPGKGILFSIPLNHLVEKRWHVEIPYTFDLPRGKGRHDDNAGGEPEMVLAYDWYDLPPKSRAALK